MAISVRIAPARYLAAEDCYWNSGVFLFRAYRYLQELDTFSLKILICCRQALSAARQDLDFIRLKAEAFAR